MAYTPAVNFQDLTLYLGSCATGQCTAMSTDLTDVVFAQLPGQPSATTFTPADVGMPIAIVGGGPVDPLMPVQYFVQGSTFVTTIAAYVSPSEVTLTDAPDTTFSNTGFFNIIVFRPCLMASDVSAAPLQFQYNSSIAPGTRDTCQFSVLVKDSAYLARFSVICRGQPVYLTSASDVLGIDFGGYIDTLTVGSYPGVSGIFSYSATCASWAGLATRRVVPPVNAQVITGAGDEVFKKVVLYFLKDDGVSATASAAPDITLPCAAGASINTLLDQIVSLVSTPTTAWYWYTDPWRNFVLAQRTATAAPWDVTDGSDLFAGDTPYQQTIQTTNNQLANFVFGIGTKVLINTFNVTFVGDGSTTNFSTPQPIGAAPSITLNSVAQTVGVLGVDTGMEWYWSEGSSTISQAVGGTVLTASDTLVVTYEAETPAVAQAPNSTSLAAIQQVEGTSGEYDYAFTITTPIDPEDLLNLTVGYENNYNEPAQTVTFYTLYPGLQSGQLQAITLSKAGISGSFLIATIQVTVKSNVLVWMYTAFGGANIGNAITALVQFINRGTASLALTSPVQAIQVGLHEITIDHTKVVGADKTNFIFCFTGTYAWLTGPPTGNVAYADGADIYFSTDAEGNEVMAFDLEFYDSTTGQITAWVKIPTLSHTTDTVIYIQYGNASDSVTQAAPAEVWSPYVDSGGSPTDNYHEVYHLGESVAPYEDSTQYGNVSTGSLGVGYPARVSGYFGYAVQTLVAPLYEGIAVPSCLQGNGYNNSTGSMRVWIKMASGGGGTPYYQDIFDAQVTGAFGHGMALCVYTHFAVGVLNYDGDQLKFASSVVVDDGNWHELVMTMSPSNAYLYVDGALAATAGLGQNATMLDGNPNQISGDRGGLAFVNYVGLIAEPSVTQFVIDADTIATEWANRSDPSTFYNVTMAQQGPPPQTTNVQGNPQGTVTHVTGALTANEPVFGNGGGDVKIGSKTGNTEQVQCASGSAGATGAPLKYDANGNAVAGVVGQFVPAGGSTGEVLGKTSGTDYATGWISGDDDIQINGATSLNIIQVNATQVWIGQTEIQLNGTFI